MNEHEKAVHDLYTAREAHRVAKIARAESWGQNKCTGNDYGPCCMMTTLTSEMCDGCKCIHEANLDYRKKANLAGGALRRVLMFGKRLAKMEADNAKS